MSTRRCVLVLSGLLLGAAACSGGGEGGDTGDAGRCEGALAPAKLFNGTDAVSSLGARCVDGLDVAQGIRTGSASEYLDLPARGPLVLLDGDTEILSSAYELEADGLASVFVAGGEDPDTWRTVVLRDDLSQTIPSISWVRFVLATPTLPAPADLYVDGSVLFGGLTFDGEWSAGFEAISTGAPHPIRVEVPGHPEWTVRFDDEDFEEDRYYTFVIQAGGSGEAGDLVLGKSVHRAP